MLGFVFWNKHNIIFFTRKPRMSANFPALFMTMAGKVPVLGGILISKEL